MPLTALQVNWAALQHGNILQKRTAAASANRTWSPDLLTNSLAACVGVPLRETGRMLAEGMASEGLMFVPDPEAEARLNGQQLHTGSKA